MRISRLNPESQEYKSYLLPAACKYFSQAFFFLPAQRRVIIQQLPRFGLQQLLKTFLRRSLRDKLADVAGRSPVGPESSWSSIRRSHERELITWEVNYCRKLREGLFAYPIAPSRVTDIRQPRYTKLPFTFAGPSKRSRIVKSFLAAKIDLMPCHRVRKLRGKSSTRPVTRARFNQAIAARARRKLAHERAPFLRSEGNDRVLISVH